jgi:hypothetical protein
MKTPKDVYDVCRLFLLDARTEISEEMFNHILGLIRSRNLVGLANLSTSDDPSVQYIDARTYQIIRQIEAFFKKNSLFVSDEAEDNARLSFERGERLCRITNKRLDFYYTERDRLDPDLSLWMSRAERYVQTLLGDFDTFLNDIPSLIKVTSGASANRPRSKSQRYQKISKRLGASVSSIPYLQALSNFFGYGPLKPRITPYNRLEVVPKSYKTHRTIACEPEGNLFLQLAFDEYAKSRLRFRGQDLRDQTKNQRLAKEGSITGKYATIDLSMASDCLSYNTVAWLLPEPWFRYLSDCRSRFYHGAFGKGEYAKFSSMGNGATFSLETLVFCSCAYAVGSKEFSVYGDDIIIESELTDDLLRLLSFIGFKVNTEKSFWEGPFRESCGKDYWEGTLVTPQYLRDGGEQKTVLSHNVNVLASIAKPFGELWKYLRQFITDENLLLVPHSESSIDGVWIDPHWCYEARILRSRHSRLWAKRYVPYANRKMRTVVADTRTLFLWYLAKYQTGERSCAPILVQTTGYSPLRLKYRRKVSPWYPPRVATPDHLYWWSDYLLHSLSRESNS